MKATKLSRFEDQIGELFLEEQLWLIERLVHRVRERHLPSLHEMANQLTIMANDKEIQSELRRINEEFAIADMSELVQTCGN